VEKRGNLQEQNVVVSGFVMTKTNMFSFLMLKIAAIGIMIDIRSVRFITMKNTRVIGKSANNAGMILKLKYMYGMEPTSIILKDLRIPLSMSRHGAQGAEKSST